MVATGEKKWYIIRVKPGSEFKMATKIRTLIDIKNMNEYFEGMIVPSEEIMNVKGGQKKMVEKVMYSGYIFIQMNMCDETWHFINRIDGALGFINSEASVPQKQIDEILEKMEASRRDKKLELPFQKGDMVRVNSGPFENCEGVIEEIYSTRNRINVSIMVFGRLTAVELEFEQVEKVS